MTVPGKTMPLERISIYNQHSDRLLGAGVNVTKYWFLLRPKCLNPKWKTAELRSIIHINHWRGAEGESKGSPACNTLDTTQGDLKASGLFQMPLWNGEPFLLRSLSCREQGLAFGALNKPLATNQAVNDLEMPPVTQIPACAAFVVSGCTALNAG